MGVEADPTSVWTLRAAVECDDERAVVVLTDPSGRSRGIEALDRVAMREVKDVDIDVAGRIRLGDRRLSLGGIVVEADESHSDGPGAVPLAEALALLVPATQRIGQLSAPLRRIAAHVRGVGGVRRVGRTPRGALIGLACDYSWVPVPPPVRIGPPSLESEGGVFRAPAADAIALEDGGAALLIDGGFRVLSPIEEVLWRRASGILEQDLIDEVATVSDCAAAEVVQELGTLREEGVLTDVPRWYVRPDVAWVEDGVRVTALDLGSGATPVVLEGTGAAIWRALHAAGSPSERELASDLAREFGVDAGAIAPDIRGFLRELASQRLVGF